jgi:hypothetical protein
MPLNHQHRASSVRTENSLSIARTLAGRGGGIVLFPFGAVILCVTGRDGVTVVPPVK